MGSDTIAMTVQSPGKSADSDKQTTPFKLLVADKVAEEGLDYIRGIPDSELLYKPGLSEEELAEVIGEADGMIVRSGVQVTAKVLADPGRLKAIARAGVGVDNIDISAATNKGIVVMNTAEASTISTAEHAFALMLGMCRNLGPAYKTMADGGWDRSKFVGRQLAGKTLGIVGFGRIGQTIASRALSFDMTVIAYDPFINASTMLDGRVKMYRDFEAMAPHADIFTFHVPLNDQTRGMLGKDQFSRCRKGVMVVNASRGGVVDEEALLEALESGQCERAALDVYVDEPPAEDSPLRNHPKLLTTPHLGASTKEAQQAVSIAAVDQLLAFFRGEGIKGAVNAGGLRVDLDPLQERFVDLSRRMAYVINPMITRGISNVTIDICGKKLAPASGTIERTAMCALLQWHLDDPVNLINVGQVADARDIHIRTTTEDEHRGAPELTIEIEGPASAVDKDTDPRDRVRKIVGTVQDDMRPRIVEINGYHMDMIPADEMVLILNEDQPGVIGMVGTEFGEAGVNIADMAISRRGKNALMVLKVDSTPPKALFNRLLARPGILKVSHVHLDAEPE